MKLIRWLNQRNRKPSDEDGFTLTEVMASMTIMSIFLTIFTAAMIQLYGTSNKANAVAESSGQINLAFQRLDREIRYATVLDRPTRVTSTGAWYVEFITSNTGVNTCTQLRLATDGVLSQRSWTPGPSAVPAWAAMASQISSPAGGPFTFYPPDDVHRQRLRLTLHSDSGNGTATTTSETDVTFTAINSSRSASETAGADVCTDQGRT